MLIFENEGFCPICEQDVVFKAYSEWFRDYYICPICQSIPRERALMYVIKKFYPQWKDLAIHESSPAERGSSIKLKNEAPRYISSQYYPDVKSGHEHNGFRSENLEALSFEDESVDLHITQDVFEHLFHPEKAFQEISRTLRSGGAHIFTTPLINKNRPTEWLAKLSSDGKVDFLKSQPEYHKNPISDEGSLVTVHWGYDITEFIFKASGLFTEIVFIDALDLGIRAEYIEVLITRKRKLRDALSKGEANIV